MPDYSTRLNLPKPLGTESFSRAAHLDLVEAIDAATDAAATASKLILRDAGGRGKVTSPAAADDIANKAFVDAAIAALVASSPAALDTLNELANALGKDPNFATTMTNALAAKFNTADFVTKLLSVDGQGSGLDADTVRGAVALPASAYTAADVLAKIKTVDGTGSGVDADTLDGLHASSFPLVATGSYTGDGTNGRFINVGFTPKILFLSGGLNITNNVAVVVINGAPFHLLTGTNNGGVMSTPQSTSYAQLPHIATNGFNIDGTQAYYPNGSGGTFSWMALG